MAEVEPVAKRQKMQEIDEIFSKFFENEHAVDELRNACDVLEGSFKGFSFLYYKLVHTNARVSRGFSEASVETEVYMRSRGNEYFFPAEDIFVDGIDVLKKYLDKQLPNDETMLKALSKLLQFLCSFKDHQTLVEERKNVSEGHWAMIVAQHLLVKLAFHDTYTVDTCSGVTSSSRLCPCKEHDKMVGEVGDTSYGCAEGWHGSADILLEGVPVKFVKGDQAQEDEDSSVSSVEIKAKTYFSENEKAQMIAETIVFSFLQNNNGNIKSYLVPGIGISSESFRVYFYDSVNDVLIGSLPTDLFSGNKIIPKAVTFLWLTLNYRLFCSGLSEEMKMYKAGFYDRVQERISLYTDKNKLTRPCIALYKPKQNEESELKHAFRPEKNKDKRKSHVTYFKMTLKK